jgi:hypothetical protein
MMHPSKDVHAQVRIRAKSAKRNSGSHEILRFELTRQSLLIDALPKAISR